MNRTIKQWAACDPSSMAKQSSAAISYAFKDAKEDIATLQKEISRLQSQLNLSFLSEDHIKMLARAHGMHTAGYVGNSVVYCVKFARDIEKDFLAKLRGEL